MASRGLLFRFVSFRLVYLPIHIRSVSGEPVGILAALSDLVEIKLGVAAELLHVVHHLPPRVEDSPVRGEEEEEQLTRLRAAGAGADPPSRRESGVALYPAFLIRQSRLERSGRGVPGPSLDRARDREIG